MTNQQPTPPPPIQLTKFWLNGEPLTERERILWDSLHRAHRAAVDRENCSSLALQQAAIGSRRFTGALAGALATIGELHGPVEAAQQFIAREDWWEETDRILTWGGKVPGWGHSSIKDGGDPLFECVDDALHFCFPEWREKLQQITLGLHSAGKKIFPNAAAFTGCVALCLGMPSNLSPFLFVRARLDAWARLFHTVANPAKP